jgi:hypothetical protein
MENEEWYSYIKSYYNDHQVFNADHAYHYLMSQESNEIEALVPQHSMDVWYRLVNGGYYTYEELAQEIVMYNKMPDRLAQRMKAYIWAHWESSGERREVLSNWCRDLYHWKLGMKTIGEACLEFQQALDRTDPVLLEGITPGDIVGYNDGRWKMDVYFNLDRHIVQARASHRIMARTAATICMYAQPGTDEVVFDKLQGSSLDGCRVNPHINGGRGGNACLGGYAMEFTKAVIDREWINCYLLARAFHRDYDPKDPWGRGIIHNKQVWYLDTEDGIVEVSEGVSGMRELQEVLSEGYYIKGGKLLSHRDYVECRVTGKLIKKENAVRVPVYISEEVLRTWQKTPFINNLVKNKDDRDRLDRKADEVWKKYRKRHLPKLMLQAKDEEERRQKVLDSLLKLTCEGHVSDWDVNRLVGDGKQRQVHHRREVHNDNGEGIRLRGSYNML